MGIVYSKVDMVGVQVRTASGWVLNYGKYCGVETDHFTIQFKEVCWPYLASLSSWH